MQGNERQLLFPITSFCYLKNSQKVFLAAAQFLESKGVDIAGNYSWFSFPPSPECLNCYWAPWCHIKAADAAEGHALEVSVRCTSTAWDWELPLCIHLPFSAHLRAGLEQNNFTMITADWNSKCFLVILMEALSTCKIFLVIDQELFGNHKICCCRSDWKSIWSSVSCFCRQEMCKVFPKKKKTTCWGLRSLYLHTLHRLHVHPFIFNSEIKSGSLFLFYAT